MTCSVAGEVCRILNRPRHGGFQTADGGNIDNFPAHHDDPAIYSDYRLRRGLNGRQRREDIDMDIGPLNRPTSPAAPTPATAGAQPVRTSVATDLPTEQTVTAVSDTAPARVEISRSAQTLQKLAQEQEKLQRRSERDEATLKRETAMDEASRELVYRVTDERTGKIVQQIPDEALLRLRAYIDEQTRRSEPEAGAVEKMA
jgi:flagellar protein FlaG